MPFDHNDPPMPPRESTQTRPRPPQKKRKRKRSRLPFLLLLLIVIAVVLIGYNLAKKYMPNFETITPQAAYSLNDQIYFIYNGKLLERDDAPVLNNDALYIPVNFIKDQIDPYIFWDASANRLTITTANRVIQMRTDELTYYVNNTPTTLALPVYQINGEGYLPADFLQDFYNLNITYKPEYRLAWVDNRDQSFTTATVTVKKTALRPSASIKAPVLEQEPQGTALTVYETDGDFTRVRAESGIIGYVRTKDFGDAEKSAPVAPTPEPDTASAPWQSPDKITLVWDQVTTVEANSNDNRRIADPGADVLAPTWFSFDADKLNGDIINIADKSYVDWAHENGYQVWALVTDNFDPTVNHAILSDTDTREYVTRQLLAYVAMYDLDGINIDFEALRQADAAYYLQFLRELAPLLHEQDAVLSVDLFVPTYTKYYNRTEIGKVVDYACVMTYDEHTSASNASGPVASLPFVGQGLADTLAEIPKEKVLMGIPFYVRVWREETVDEQTAFTIENLDMDSARERFEANGAEFTWLPDIGSYYAEYTATEDGTDVVYKTWLEDARSVEEKLKIARQFDVKGVACWKRGLQSDGIFELIAQYM